MKFGICTSLDNSVAMTAAGWDFVEESTQGLLQGLLPDTEWKGLERARSSQLPILAANVLVPGSLKISGPDADLGRLREYMTNVLRRAGQVGVETLVFGSGGARNVPEGFDRDHAVKQIAEFARLSALIAAEHNVTIVVEPLNRKECNIINSVKEGMEYVKAVNHPNFQCLVDSYHFWLENEPLENLRAAMPWIRHVHLADVEGRVPPGQSGSADYRPFFRVLKEANYAGKISVESGQFKDIPGQGPRVLEFIKRQWSEA